MTTPTMTPSGWYPDPSLRHEYRFWDGTGWSAQVSDRGLTATDPELAPPTKPAAAPTVRPAAAPGSEVMAPPGPGPVPPGPQPTMPTPMQPTPTMPTPMQPMALGPMTLGPQWQSQEQGAPPGPAAAPAPARGGGGRWVLLVAAIVAVVAALGLIVGLLIWAPWVSKVPTAPVAQRAESLTSTSVLVQWAPATTGPTVDAYVIRRDGVQVNQVPGTVTSYQDKALAPATTYRYTIVAVAGGLRSVPSSVLVGTTLTPPVSEARLQGSWSVTSTVTKSGGGSLTVGTKRTGTWLFTPKCAEGPCAVVLSGNQGGSANPHPFTMTLTGSGPVYTGSTKAHITHCGQSKALKDVVNSVAVKVTVKTAGVDARAWSANSWVGTMTISSPYTSAAGGWYCPAQSVTTSLTASR